MLIPMLLSCRWFILALLSFGMAGVAAAQSPTAAQSDDRAAVRQAALDYVEGVYEVDSTRIVRSVHPDLVKIGYYVRSGAYRRGEMSYAQLKTLAATWNRDQQRVNPDSARKEVVIYDVLDKTASAKVSAHWGSDYLLLAKTDGRWMIRQILWQSPPMDE